MNFILNINTAFSPPFLLYLHIDPEEIVNSTIVGKLQAVLGMDKRIKSLNKPDEEVEHIIRNRFVSFEVIMDEFLFGNHHYRLQINGPIMQNCVF